MRMRETYEPLFADHMLNELKRTPALNSFHNVPALHIDAQNSRFFDAWRTDQKSPFLFGILRTVLIDLQASDPALASHVLAAEVGSIGLKRTAILSSTLGIDIDVHHLFLHLGEWIDRLDSVADMIPSKSGISTSEFSSITQGDRIFPLYPNIIFGARSNEERALLRRLFARIPLTTTELNALVFHRDYKREALLACAAEPDQDGYGKLARRAAHLGLAFELRDDVEPGFRSYAEPFASTKDFDALMSQFLSNNHAPYVARNLGKALLFSNIEINEALVLVHSRLVDYGNGLATDVERSAWLTHLASQLPIDFEAAPDDAKVNVAMGALAIRLLIDFSHVNPVPLQTYLYHMNSLPTHSEYKTWGKVMLTSGVFSDEITVCSNVIKGQYSRHALKRLKASGVVQDNDGQLSWLPQRLDRIPDNLKISLTDLMVDVLSDEDLQEAHRLTFTSQQIQKIVDSNMLSDLHWRRISKSITATNIMCKANLPQGVLNVVGDRFLELSFGSGLGL
jgi:hypothetical protein